MRKENAKNTPAKTAEATAIADDLQDHFERWYPGLKIKKNAERPASTLKMAA